MEIIPKEFRKSSKGSNTLLYFSLALLFFSIASFFVFGHFVRGFEKEHEVLEQAMTEKNEKIRPIEGKILSYQRKIDDFSFLIARRLESSKFFIAFEKIVHPQVWFSEFSLNLKEKRVILSGQAQNFEVLWQQLYIIRNEDWIKDADLGTISIGEEGKIDFSLFFTLNPKLFNENQ